MPRDSLPIVLELVKEFGTRLTEASICGLVDHLHPVRCRKNLQLGIVRRGCVTTCELTAIGGG
jgi:hypothetical protein